MQFNFYYVYFAIILLTVASASFLVGDVEKYVTMACQLMSSILTMKGISDNKNAVSRNGKKRFKY